MFYMVFDVESIGLHGEGFAVGWVVVDETGRELEAARISCPPDEASGVRDADTDESRLWVAEHVPNFEPDYEYPSIVRNSFWAAWRRWRDHPAMLVADCCWPVEARFLLDCVRDLIELREWQGPYPLHDLASIRLAKGLDPLGTEHRLPNELPEHDPLADARQSARRIIEALYPLNGFSAPRPVPDKPAPAPLSEPERWAIEEEKGNTP